MTQATVDAKYWELFVRDENEDFATVVVEFQQDLKDFSKKASLCSLYSILRRSLRDSGRCIIESFFIYEPLQPKSLLIPLDEKSRFLTMAKNITPAKLTMLVIHSKNDKETHSHLHCNCIRN